MGNSIEEDIKIIEDFILKTDVDYSEYNEQIVRDISYQAIQHLLSDYKRVLKENKELDERNTFLTVQYEEMFDILNRIDKEADFKEELEKVMELYADWNEVPYGFNKQTMAAIKALLYH